MFKYRDYVFVVYKEGSFSKAALKLNVSQPALSAAIKKAEERFGHLIFNRGTTPISLTEYGRHYIDSVVQVNSVEEELENKIANIDTLSSGEITIGTNHVYASLLFPQLISLFHTNYPKIKITLLEGSATSNKERLADGIIDLILDCGGNLNHSDAFEQVIVGSELLLLAGPTPVLLESLPPNALLDYEDIVLGKCHKPSCPSVSLKQFADGEFILLTTGNDTRFREDQMFIEAGIAPNSIMEVEQMATSYLILEKNNLLSFASETLIKRSEPKENISYCKINSQYASRDIFFSYVKRQYIRKVITEFIHFATSFPL